MNFVMASVATNGRSCKRSASDACEESFDVLVLLAVVEDLDGKEKASTVFCVLLYSKAPEITRAA